MKVKVAIIVLNYLRHQDTLKCLTAVKRADLPKGSLLICIDNSPNDESARVIKSASPDVHLIKAKRNLGFAGGNNLGIKYALDHQASHILIINPDVVVGKYFFQPLLATIESAPSVGLVAPAIKHYQNTRLFYGLEGSVNWQLATAKHLNLSNLISKSVRPAQFVTFACVLIKAEVFQKIGLLDDGYFMYLEDVDYCIRARRNGYEIFLDPAVVVDHRTSSSFKKATDKLPISFKSQLRFVNKWLPFPRNILPLLYAFLFYPYLFLLWTYFDFKNRLAK